MELIPPRVVLPLSECSTHVRVQGQLAGATVEILADATLIGQGLATGPDQAFHITASLSRGQTVRARQSMAGTGSGQSPEGVGVLRGPSSSSDLGPLSSLTHLYECGGCVWLDGAFPGATVTLTAGGVTLGSGESPDGNARLSLSPELGASAPAAQQVACGVVGQVRNLPSPDPAPRIDPTRAAPPSIAGSLSDCQPFVDVKNAIDGAAVTVIRDSGEETACFDRGELSFYLSTPLKEREKVQVRQELASCELKSDPSDPAVPVGPRSSPTPRLHWPICEKDVTVRVSGLWPQAQVRFMEGGVEFARGQAWAETCDFFVPSLFGRSSIAVEQGICDPLEWSDPSNQVELTRQSAYDPAPKIIGPIFEFGRMVHVTGVAPGMILELVSHRAQPDIPIGWAYADDFEIDVPATVPLASHDAVYIRVSSCGDTVQSGDEPVQALPDLRAPTVAPLVHDCGGLIPVENAVPGSDVDVYVNGQFAGWSRTGLADVSVPISIRPVNGDQIQARLTIGGHTTPLGSAGTFVQTGATALVPGPGGVVSDRICQLTGANDPQPARAHLNDTTQWGVRGTDLGIVVDHAGRTYFFFGDEGGQGGGGQPDADPVAYTTDLEMKPAGFKIAFVQQSNSNDFRRLAVLGLPPLGNFEVPTGAFSYDGTLYVFVSRRNGPGDADVMRLSYLGGAPSPGQDFNLVYPGPIDSNTTAIPSDLRFMNIAAAVVRNSDWPGLPSSTGDGLLLWASGQYRASDVYLAWAPLTPGQPPPFPGSWFYWPWNRPGPAVNDLHQAQPLLGGAAIGELSVQYIEPLHRWLMLYNQFDPGSGGLLIYGRTARYPWGPWEPLPSPVFDPTRDQAWRNYMHVPGQDNLLDSNRDEPGAPYGPYIVNRFTKWDKWRSTATVYYLMSTHIPYQVQLMSVRLHCV